MENREELEKEIKEKTLVYENVKKSAIEHITKVFNEFIVENGLSGYCHFGDIRDIIYFSIDVPRYEGEGTNDINFYFTKSCDDRYDLKVNYSMFGSIRSNEHSKVDYMIVLGKFASNFVRIENKIKEFDWDNYDKALHDLSDVHFKIHMIDLKENEIKKNEEISKIKEKLIVGQKVSFGKRTAYDHDTNEYIKIDDIHTIEKVMDKNVKFSECANRVKKEIILSQIYTKKWKFVD